MVSLKMILFIKQLNFEPNDQLHIQVNLDHLKRIKSMYLYQHCVSIFLYIWKLHECHISSVWLNNANRIFHKIPKLFCFHHLLEHEAVNKNRSISPLLLLYMIALVDSTLYVSVHNFHIRKLHCLNLHIEHC